MTDKAINRKPVIDEIYVLKGFAIIGLIIWHTYHTPLPLINRSFSNFLWRIFSEYAMPLFMFASGFLFGFSKKEISRLSDYTSFIKIKFKRLMVPYFSVWGIYITAGFAAELISGFTSLNYHVDRDFWKYILFNPIKGTALHLWFIYQLFIVFLIFPILDKLIRSDLVLFILICSMWLFPLPGSENFDFVNLRIFLFFFSFGYLYSHCKFENVNAYSVSLCGVSLGLLVIFSIKEISITEYFDTYMKSSVIIPQSLSIIKTSLGVLFYYYLSVIIKSYKNPLNYLLKYLGLYSVAIYLFHHIALGIVRIFFLNVLNVSVRLHVIASIIVFLSGMILPVLLVKYFINRFEFLPPLLLGNKKVPQLRNI